MALLSVFKVLAMFLVLSSCSASHTECFEYSEFDITSEGGMLMLKGKRFNLKEILSVSQKYQNVCFLVRTANSVVHGLWSVDYNSIIKFMKENDFNGLRLPFSVELVLSNPDPESINFYNMNKDLQNLSALQVMDKIIEACADAGIVVMLDMHSLEPDGYLNDGLWYSNKTANDKYSAEDNLKAWVTMAQRYENQWNVVAADIFNEPFDATWGTGLDATDFNRWCETAGNMLNDYLSPLGRSWLIVCQGTASSPACSDACFWGEDLEGVKDHPVKLKHPNKVVYSPHVYGPAVSNQKYFDDPNFPDNMPAIWEAHWGYIPALNESAITVGEWGGALKGQDETWLNAFVSYLKTIEAADTWFWCLNPDSGDTGGLLENDWKTPDDAKLKLLETLQPKPAKLSPKSNEICVEFE